VLIVCECPICCSLARATIGMTDDEVQDARFHGCAAGLRPPTHRRDGFRCRYCGLDGTSSFGSWLSLSWDHLLPKNDPRREDPDYIVTACMFCNVADNRYFDLAEKRGLSFEGLTPDELVAQRLPYVEATRQSYRKFWDENVHPSNQPA
jgi:hypothetical protein